MNPITREQISSIFLILFSVFFCVLSYKLSLGSITNPEAGFFPFYLGIILAGLSIKNFMNAIVQRKKATQTISTPDTRINWKNIIITLVVLFSYPLLLDVFGFPVSTFLFTAFFLRCINPQKWSVVLGTAGAAAIVFYFVFQYWLQMQFPPGMFGR